MQMLIVNPKKRRKSAKRRRKGGKKRKMSALQKQYFGGGRKTSGVKKRRKSRKRRVAALASAPAPRKASRKRRRRSAGRRRSHSGGRRMARLSFNPKSFLNDTLLPAGIGAGGALALDAALSFAAPYIPASLNTGIARSGVKLAGAVAIGMLAGMVGGRKMGEQVLAGAVVVTMYGILKPYAASVVPGVAGYDAMGWVSPAPQLGVYAGSDNAYSGQMNGMGGVGVYAGDDNGFDYYG